MKTTALLIISKSGYELAKTIAQTLPQTTLFAKEPLEGCTRLTSFQDEMERLFRTYDQLIFIGAMGICVRLIAPYVQDKYTDPAVLCVDSTARYVIPVLSGHVGGANQLAEQVASLIGATAVITTQSDNEGLWALDTLARRFGWKTEAGHDEMNKAIFTFVNREPTALLLDVRDAGTRYLEQTLPTHVRVFYAFDEIPLADFRLLIVVSPRIYDTSLTTLYYRPAVLRLGVGCRKECAPEGIPSYIRQALLREQISPLSVQSIATIELKKDEPLLPALQTEFEGAAIEIFTADELKDIPVPNPSEKPFQVTGVYGVAESCALKASGEGLLLLEKQKGVLQPGADFTFAVGMDRKALRRGHIEIVGAGPGDPELVSVRGKHFLEEADLILYAGSLVPVELTHYAKPGATVRSSADMNLEEQFALMKAFYDKGKLVVRLHTGDPCIYGAIQEQMAYFDQYHMSYHITPGISSFQAAAAALRSQFTIPERVQTIILTRGEGRTPMPEKEQLHKLAQSQSTMCIYLSAGIVEKVQAELLQAYPPETPVAVCYKLTWKEEKIYRGTLAEMAQIVRENHLTLTTLLVVGEAIDNRQGLSRLYADEFKHLFRK